MVYVMKELSCSPSSPAAGEIPFVPAIFSVLRLYTDITPSPRGHVPVNAYALSTFIFVLFRVSVCTAQKLQFGAC